MQIDCISNPESNVNRSHRMVYVMPSSAQNLITYCETMSNYSLLIESRIIVSQYKCHHVNYVYHSFSLTFEQINWSKDSFMSNANPWHLFENINVNLYLSNSNLWANKSNRNHVLYAFLSNEILLKIAFLSTELTLKSRKRLNLRNIWELLSLLMSIQTKAKELLNKSQNKCHGI